MKANRVVLKPGTAFCLLWFLGRPLWQNLELSKVFSGIHLFLKVTYCENFLCFQQSLICHRPDIRCIGLFCCPRIISAQLGCAQLVLTCFQKQRPSYPSRKDSWTTKKYDVTCIRSEQRHFNFPSPAQKKMFTLTPCVREDFVKIQVQKRGLRA